MRPSRPILFIDGYCVLCNGLATWIGKKINTPSFYIATLQNKEATDSVPKPIPTDNTTLVWWDNQDSVLTKSDAVIAVSQHLKAPYPLIGRMARWIPKCVRNRLYMWVSKNRYRWFGSKTECDMPSSTMRAVAWNNTQEDL